MFFKEWRAIAIAGEAGTGKTSVARATSSMLGWDVFGAGELFREWCERNGIDNIGANEDQDQVHDAIDFMMLEKMRMGRSVVEGRVAGVVAAVNAVPGVFSVILACSAEERYKRILRRDPDKYNNIRQVKKITDSRERQNLTTFTRRYNGISYQDKSIYNAIIETTNIDLPETVSTLLFLMNRGV